MGIAEYSVATGYPRHEAPQRFPAIHDWISSNGRDRRPPNLLHAAPFIYLEKEIKGYMSWRVEVLNEIVAAEIAALPADMQARFIRLAERIASAELESLSDPHVKHLESKLWELRLTGRDGIARALYVTAIGRKVVVVRAFVKKAQKTPRTEIELALRRAKEIT